MTYDPGWDMPKVNWQQQGSFEQGELALVDHPSDAPLVCIPPINRHWLPYVLGCLDQLTNPSSWIVSSDAAMNAILDKAIELKQLVGQAGDCMSCPIIRLQDCVLQSSCDGGATWTDVSGWSANLSTCVQNALPPQVPPNPRGDTHNQHACNLAGYLATKVIQETMVAAHSVLAASGDELTFGTDVMALIGYAFPITYAATLAFHDFFNAMSAQITTDVNTAATDPTLWSDVTCAIYSAINTVGYVDATNFAAVATNLGAISYMFAWVAPSLHNYWNELGLPNIQSQQAVGALDTVDCSACGLTPTWCYKFDFTTGAQGWVSTGGFGHLVAGVGWEPDPSGGAWFIHLSNTWSPVTSITALEIFMEWPTNPGGQSSIAAFNGGTAGNYTPGSGGSVGVPFHQTITVTGTANNLLLNLESQGTIGAGSKVYAITLRGAGTNPFGASNC